MAGSKVGRRQPGSKTVSGTRRILDTNTATGRRNEVRAARGSATTEVDRSTPNIGGLCSRRTEFNSVRRSTAKAQQRRIRARRAALAGWPGGRTKFGRQAGGRTFGGSNRERTSHQQTTQTFHEQARRQVTKTSKRRSSVPSNPVSKPVGGTAGKTAEAGRAKRTNTVRIGGNRSHRKPSESGSGRDGSSRRSCNSQSAMQRISTVQAIRSGKIAPALLPKPKGGKRAGEGNSCEAFVPDGNSNDEVGAATQRRVQPARRGKRVPPSSLGSSIGGYAEISNSVTPAKRGAQETGSPADHRSSDVDGVDRRRDLRHNATESGYVRIHVESEPIRGPTADHTELHPNAWRHPSSDTSGRYCNLEFPGTDGRVCRHGPGNNSVQLLRLAPPLERGESKGRLAKDHIPIRRESLAARNPKLLLTTGNRFAPPTIFVANTRGVQEGNGTDLRNNVSLLRPDSIAHGNPRLRGSLEGQSVGRIQPATPTMGKATPQPRSLAPKTTDATDAQQGSSRGSIDLLLTPGYRSTFQSARSNSAGNNRRHLRHIVRGLARMPGKKAGVSTDVAETVSKVSSAPHASGAGRNRGSIPSRDEALRHQGNGSVCSSSRRTERQYERGEELEPARGQTKHGSSTTAVDRRSSSATDTPTCNVSGQRLHGQQEQMRRNGTRRIQGSRPRDQSADHAESSATDQRQRQDGVVHRLFQYEGGPTDLDDSLHCQIPASRLDGNGRLRPKLAAPDFRRNPTLLLSTRENSGKDAPDVERSKDGGCASGTILPKTSTMVGTVQVVGNQGSGDRNTRKHVRPSSRKVSYELGFDPEMPADSSTAIRRLARARGLTDNVIDCVDASYANGMRQAQQPFKWLVDIGRELNIPVGTPWNAAIARVCTELYERKLYNRAMTTAKASLMVFKLGAAVDLSGDEVIKKIRRAAERRQQEGVTMRGEHAHTTLWLRRFHVRVISMVDGKLSKIRTWSFLVLRTMATNYLAMLFALRPQEIGNHQLKREACRLTIETVGGKQSLTAIEIRLWDCKESDHKHMNAHVRSGRESKIGKWSSILKQTIPTGTEEFPLPPIGAILLEYFRQVDLRTDVPKVMIMLEKQEKYWTPLFIGCPNKSSTRYPATVQNSTLTSAARRQLVEFGAIANDSDPHDFYCLRKTVLTNVLIAQPASLMIAHRLARHSRSTFFNNYELDVPAVQGEVLDRLSTMVPAPSVPTVMMG